MFVSGIIKTPTFPPITAVAVFGVLSYADTLQILAIALLGIITVLVAYMTWLGWRVLPVRTSLGDMVWLPFTALAVFGVVRGAGALQIASLAVSAVIAILAFYGICAALLGGGVKMVGQATVWPLFFALAVFGSVRGTGALQILSLAVVLVTAGAGVYLACMAWQAVCPRCGCDRFWREPGSQVKYCWDCGAKWDDRKRRFLREDETSKHVWSAWGGAV